MPTNGPAFTEYSFDIDAGDVEVNVNPDGDTMDICINGMQTHADLLIADSAVVVYSGTGAETVNTITITGAGCAQAQAAPVHLVLGDGTSGLDINPGGSSLPAVGLTGGAVVALYCDESGGEVRLRGGYVLLSGAPAIAVEGGCEFEYVGGTLALAQGGYQAAGIGGGQNGAVGSITVSGGVIKQAQGGDDAAGIGGGYGGTVGSITVSGGVIEQAQGGTGGAGIGGGYDGAVGSISIGGNATVTATGGDGGGNNIVGYGGGAGIGAGVGFGAGASLGSLGIASGATVTATGGKGGRSTAPFDGSSAYGYGGGAAIGGGGGTALHPATAELGGSLTTIVSLPEDMSTLHLTPGAGAAAQGGTYDGQQMAGNGAAIGAGGNAYIGVAPPTDPADVNGEEKAGYPVQYAAPQAAIDYAAERLTGLVANADYTFNGAPAAADASGVYPIPDAWMAGAELEIVRSGDGVTTVNSPAQRLAIPARPAAPTGVTAVAESEPGQKDGALQNLPNGSEYRPTGQGAWQAAPAGGTATGLAPGGYEVRLAATAGSFAGTAAELRIAEGKAPTDNGDGDGGNGDIGNGASSRPGTGSSQPDAESSQPGTGSSQPGAASSQPDAESSQPDAESSQPDAESSKPDAASNQPGAASSKPGTGSSQPGADAGGTLAVSGLPATVRVGDTFTLYPEESDTRSGADGWAWDEEFFSATFNSPATFTALKEGSSTITFTSASGRSVSLSVTVLAKLDGGAQNNNAIAATGDNSRPWLYAALAVAAIALAGGLVFLKKRQSK